MRRIPLWNHRLVRPDRLPGLRLLATLALAAAVAPAPARAQPPGPERFAKVPTTPIEFWGAADYLVRSGQAEQAVPYLQAFLKGEPTDEDLLRARDQYGAGSFLRLTDFAPTRPLAEPLIQRLAAASGRIAGDPARLDRAVAALPNSPEERTYALERLREAGAFAVPALIRGMDRPGLSAADRGALAEALGRLSTDAVPPLVAALGSGDERLAADAANALGRIGDRSAVPALRYLAARPETSGPARQAATRAVERLTGRSIASQPGSPARALVEEARGYHLHKVRMLEPARVWTWDEQARVPAAREVSASEAEELLGLRAARQALELEPADVEAQAVLVSLALDKAVERAGLANFPASDPSGAFGTALAAGPDVLARVLGGAIDDGRFDLAAAAAAALARVTDRDSLSGGPKPHPLVQALSAPDRRAQFAAAKALVGLEPRRPFHGSSRVVPALARFVGGRVAPRAVVIDGNLSRANQLASLVRPLGYDVDVAVTGDQGFRLAAGSADVELVLVAPVLVQGAWQLRDTLANLRADARTAGLPVFVIGPLGLEDRLGGRIAEFPGVGFLVTPPDSAALKPQLDRGLERLGARPLTEEERARYALEATALLGRIAKQPGSPFEPDLARAGPALTAALRRPATGEAALAALGELPDAQAQRALADALLDPSRPGPLRLGAATQLAWSVQRFGPLLTAEQERRLLDALEQEAGDPAMADAVARVIGTLRPDPARAGRRLQGYRAPEPEQAPAPAPAPTTPAADTDAGGSPTAGSGGGGSGS